MGGLTMFRKNTLSGFTLIEILTVVAIIGVLTTLTIGPIRAAQQRTRDSERKTDVNLIAQALDLYYAENRTLPGSGTPCEYTSKGASPWIPGLTARYLPSSTGKVLPVDPRQNDQTLYYTYTNLLCLKKSNPTAVQSGQSFKVQAILENTKDSDGVEVNGKKVYEVIR